MIKCFFRRVKINTTKRAFEDFLGMKSVKVSLAWQILIALVLGIIVGAVLHNQSESREWLVSNILSPAGDIFIRLIKMIVVPIVISTLVVGIAGGRGCEEVRSARIENHYLLRSDHNDCHRCGADVS